MPQALFPDILEESFQFLIAQRLEFRNLKNLDSLYPHQEFVRRYMSPYTPYKSIILFHDLGSGKSRACIATAVDHYLYDKKECIIVTKGQSGADSFMSQIIQFRQLSSQKKEWRESIFKMRRYTSMSNQIAEMSDEEIKQTYSNKIIVLDEVHNIRFPGNNDMTDCVYKSLMKIVQNCKNTKIMMATATPMTDNENQLEPLLQMCNFFKYGDFEHKDMKGIISYNPYVLDKPKTYNINNVYDGMYASCMIEHQKEHYKKHFEMGIPNDIYRSWTHLSLFCTPEGKFGKEITDNFMDKRNRTAQITPVSSKVTKEISYISYSPKPEFREMLSGENLRNCSCKYSAFIDLLDCTEGNVFVFVEEVQGSGIVLLSTILEANGYEMYIGENLEDGINQNPKRFTMCVGSLEICPNIQDRLDGFNSPLNKDGQYVRILLGSRVIGESITLMNVRHFHCITPHWNNSTINQAVGRVVRNGSHNALEPNKQTVNIYMHTAILEDNLASSIDFIKLITCHEKQESIQQQENIMKEIAVDKYCCIVPEDIAPNITEFSVFCAAYIKYHIEDIMSYLKMVSNVCYNISELSNDLNINIEVLSQALCIIIRDNIPYEKNKYLRAYGDTVFLVNDCSLSYVMFPPKTRPENEFLGSCAREQILYTRDEDTRNEEYASLAYVEPLSIDNAEKYQLDISVRCENLSLAQFRYLPVLRKITYLEKKIQEQIFLDNLRKDNQANENIMDNTETIPYFLSNLFAVIDNIPCHLLWYRHIESAYTTSKIVPKKPCGKTRILVDAQGRRGYLGTSMHFSCDEVNTCAWIYVDENEEKEFINIYEELHNNFLCKFFSMIDSEDNDQPGHKGGADLRIYGIISTIDGKMRIRQRNDIEQCHSLTITDNRRMKRGKSLSSLKISELLDIMKQLKILGVYSSRRDMINKIDEFLIEKRLFYIL